MTSRGGQGFYDDSTKKSAAGAWGGGEGCEKLLKIA